MPSALLHFSPGRDRQSRVAPWLISMSTGVVKQRVHRQTNTDADTETIIARRRIPHGLNRLGGATVYLQQTLTVDSLTTIPVTQVRAE